jgi:hypothetical protein
MFVLEYSKRGEEYREMYWGGGGEEVGEIYGDMFPENRFKTRNNVHYSKDNNKHSALPFISVLFYMGYVNQYLTLPNHSV